MSIQIDGEPDFLIGFDGSMPDLSYYELIKDAGWGIPAKTPEEDASRRLAIKQSWANDPVRVEQARLRMVEMNKSRTGPRHYSQERNNKIKASWVRRKQEKTNE